MASFTGQIALTDDDIDRLSSIGVTKPAQLIGFAERRADDLAAVRRWLGLGEDSTRDEIGSEINALETRATEADELQRRIDAAIAANDNGSEFASEANLAMAPVAGTIES